MNPINNTEIIFKFENILKQWPSFLWNEIKMLDFYKYSYSFTELESKNVIGFFF